MMSSVSLPTETQMGAIQKAIPMPTTTQAIRKPGKSGPAVFALCDPGPRLRDFSQKIYSKAKPSATSRQLGSRTEGFAKPISSEPAPSHRPWICALGATPIRRPSPYHPRSVAIASEQEFFCKLETHS
jgi:hypothetical protein